MEEPTAWDIEILPRKAWWRVDLREFWHYRDLLVLLVSRDLTSQYKQTVLGPVWLVAQPLLTTLTYVVMFGMIARSAPAGIPPMLFYLTGIVPWTYFANVVNKTSRSLIGNSSVLTKVYFPRLVIPVSITLSALVTFLIQLALVVLMIAGYMLFGGLHLMFSPQLLLLPLLILIMSLMGLGAGMLVSALTTKYRDVSFMVAFGTQLLMFISPVIFPLSMVRDKAPKLLPFLHLNPMTPVIEAMRAITFGGAVDMHGLLLSALFSFGLLLLGTALFQRIERSFADTV